ncbi:interleukin-1 receptor-like 2 [Stegostoma tigrinum]|uniref:interleukin-1 receptor-like 2 n=1 Tax=Stegostoma tigrinum TaxID=3053191 RepID=UPI00202B8B88|nr:interleukin-1 receptor-like 2 [Stegostoma tigrinum]
MTVSLVVFIFICKCISSCKVSTLSVHDSNISGQVPQILYPSNNTIEALIGSKLDITCTVMVDLHSRIETLVYWLANRSYIEDYSKNTRVKEIRSERREKEAYYIDAHLNFSEIKTKDFEINFLCVVLSEDIERVSFVFIKPAVSNASSDFAVGLAVLIGIIIQLETTQWISLVKC